MLAWLPLLLAVAVFVIIHSHNQSLNEAMVRHGYGDDDGGDGGDGNDDSKVCCQDQGETAFSIFFTFFLIYLKP